MGFKVPLFIYCIWFLLLLIKRIWKAVVEIENNASHGNEYGAYILFFVFTGIFTIISIIRLTCILNFYNWVSVFYPEGAIALKALSSVGIDL